MLVILSGVGLFVLFAMLTISPDIEFGLYDTTTAQALNTIRHHLTHGLSMQAWLMGGEHPDSHVYGNMPTYHMTLSYLLVKAGILDNSYLHLQFITIVLFASLVAYSTKYVFDKTSSPLAAILFAIAILSNIGVSYIYKDIWWGPYTLFFCFVPLLFMLTNPNARLIPLLLGSIQFAAVFDAVLFVVVTYLALTLRTDRKIQRCAYYYAAGATLGFVILIIARSFADTSPGNVSIALIIRNMVDVNQSHFIRFAYYYLLHPLAMAAWLCTILTYIITKQAYPLAALVIGSLAWLIVFPEHGMHHSYHYISILLFALTLYIFTAKYPKPHLLYITATTYIALSFMASVFAENSYKKIDYSDYAEISEHVQIDDVVGMNVFSYPFSYYSNRAFKYVPPETMDYGTSNVMVVEDFKQSERGLHRVYSLIKAVASPFNVSIPNVLEAAYRRRQAEFLEQSELLTDNLLQRGYIPVWESTSLNAVLYKKPD